MSHEYASVTPPAQPREVAHLTVTVAREVERRIAHLQGAAWVGLLRKAPNLDGNGFREIEHGRYARRPLSLPDRAAGVRVPDLSIKFEGLPVRLLSLWGAGLFDGKGLLLGSGALVPHEAQSQRLYWLPSIALFGATV